ncbi:MAG: hypothetical protein JSV04_02490 [Candidatus Heimdallarchaeota archaeon]|nr:MAG: hypothetical protein JSV04_02490 [Candidatus Heimdallarchaeota archaeon]
MIDHEKEEKTLFQIPENDSGELEPFKSSSRLLKKDSVYILLDNTLKKIFLWIGQSADVRSKFIASTAAQKLRNLTGLTYRVITIDQGGESKEFMRALSPMTIPEILERVI